MSIAYMNLFTESIVSGRGFIAVSVVIFARFMPVRAMWGALLFGFASALQMRLQALGIDMANQLMLMLPYIMTIAALIFASKKAEFPEVLIRFLIPDWSDRNEEDNQNHHCTADCHHCGDNGCDQY